MPVNSFDDYPMTWKPVLSGREKPAYIQLAEQLEADIRKGKLKPGTKLPPQRELADYLDVNLSTISRAMKLCSKKGLLTGNVGRGTYVSYNISTNILKTNDNGAKPLIDMSSMVPENIYQSEVRELLTELMSEKDFDNYLQYSSGIMQWHKETAAKLMKRAGCSASADNILLAEGGQNAITAVLTGLFSKVDRVGTEPLTYPGFKSAAMMAGIQPVAVEWANHEITEEGIRYAVKNNGIKAIYLMPEYQNPVTHIMSDKSRRMIAECAKELDILIIEDAICSLLGNEKRNSIHEYAPDNTIFILSLSKTLVPALRTSYIAVPEKYRQQLDDALYNINLSPSSLLTELASRLIASDRFEELIKRRRYGIQQRNKIADNIFNEHQLLGDENCLHRWLRLPEQISGIEFEKAAAKKGVAVYGSDRFAVGRKVGENGVRIAICAPKNKESLINGLEIIKKLYEEFLKDM